MPLLIDRLAGPDADRYRRPPPGTGLVIGLALSALFYFMIAAIALLV